MPCVKKWNLHRNCEDEKNEEMLMKFYLATIEAL